MATLNVFYRFNRPGEEDLPISKHEWGCMQHLGKLGGWKPSGTAPPDLYYQAYQMEPPDGLPGHPEPSHSRPGIIWSGNYNACSNQCVTADDAWQLAGALNNQASAIFDFGLRGADWRVKYTDADQICTLQAELRGLSPEAAIRLLRGLESSAYPDWGLKLCFVMQFCRFCRKGSFFISSME